MILASFFAEILVNKRAVMVHHNGEYYFPTYGDIIPGSTFGLDYKYETNYRELAKRFKAEDKGNWVVMPPIPYDAYENDLKEDQFPPFLHPFRKSIISEPIPSEGTLRRDWSMVSGLQFSFLCCSWPLIMRWGSASGVPWDFGVVYLI